MAMVIVLTATFIVLATISVSVAMIMTNIDKVSGGANRDKALANAQRGLERARGKYILNNGLFSGCNAGDCVDTSSISACGSCADMIYGSTSDGNRVEVDAITQPTNGGGFGLPTAGSATLLATGYYKSVARQRSLDICLNYCSVSLFNCGDNGCGGSCGECGPGSSCESGVCSTPTSCSDITMECRDDCVEGDACGGGKVSDSVNNTVVIGGGCTNTSGSGCNGGLDALTEQWDNTAGIYTTTNAIEAKEGELNIDTLKSVDPTLSIFPAAQFCDSLTFNGFNDWYLPASDELQTLNTLWQATTLNNFQESCYWSSTESAQDSASIRDFTGFLGSPCSNTGIKSENNYIRCVRRY